MKAILGYASMIAMSTLVLILGVVGLLIGEEPIWPDIMLMIVGFFNLFGWSAGALYDLNQSIEDNNGRDNSNT